MSKWFVKGDVDGFFGLWMDNLINLLLIVSFLKGLLGFPDSLIFGRVLPAAALSLLGGNLFYTWQARRLAAREGRDDVTAMPYGLNTVTLFAFIFFVMLPVKLKTGSAEAAWKAGMAACFVSGVIETVGALAGGWIRRVAPRAALLSALGGIALTFIAMDFAFRIWENPLLSMIPLGIILVHYFGGFRFPFGVPGGLVAVAVGVVLSAVIRGFPGGIPAPVGLALPSFAFGPLSDALFGPLAWDYLAVSIPMGLMTLVGSLMCLESAAAGGDNFDTGSSLAVNGAGSLLAACLGSCFPTTIYIGHPAWKAVGARSGYSAMNGVVMTILCLTGSIAALSKIIPGEALFALMLWIGVMMLTQAFQAVPKNHGPAVAIGLDTRHRRVGSADGGILLKGSGNELVESGAGCVRQSGIPPRRDGHFGARFSFHVHHHDRHRGQTCGQGAETGGRMGAGRRGIELVRGHPRLANHARRRRQLLRLGGGARHSCRLFANGAPVLLVRAETPGKGNILSGLLRVRCGRDAFRRLERI